MPSAAASVPLTMASAPRSPWVVTLKLVVPLLNVDASMGQPVKTLPGWLEAFVKVNPVSHLVSAARALANQGMVTSEVGWTLLACLAVIAVFAPLSVRSYKRKL